MASRGGAGFGSVVDRSDAAPPHLLAHRHGTPASTPFEEYAR